MEMNSRYLPDFQVKAPLLCRGCHRLWRKHHRCLWRFSFSSSSHFSPHALHCSLINRSTLSSSPCCNFLQILLFKLLLDSFPHNSTFYITPCIFLVNKLVFNKTYIVAILQQLSIFPRYSLM